MGQCLEGCIILGEGRISIIVRVIRCACRVCQGCIGVECTFSVIDGMIVVEVDVDVDAEMREAKIEMATIIWFWICRIWLSDWVSPLLLPILI